VSFAVCRMDLLIDQLHSHIGKLQHTCNLIYSVVQRSGGSGRVGSGSVVYCSAGQNMQCRYGVVQYITVVQ
jgi:hypothetical protein